MKKSPVKVNLIFNYIGSVYTFLVGIFVLPLYLKYLGPEAYGLVAFFTLVQSWMTMLDVGLSPTLGRSVAIAKVNAGAGGFRELMRLLRSLEILFVSVSILVVLVFFSSKNFIATEWFTVENLDLKSIGFCIAIIGIIVGIRWVGGLYRSGIAAMEYQVWLNLNNIVFSTVKVSSALGYFHFFSDDVRGFFIIQLVIAAFEVSSLLFKFYSIIPEKLNIGLRFSWLSLRKIIPFASGIAYTSWLWIFLTQFDKLLLSKYLSLSDFGFYALIALLASSVSQLSGPVKAAILPKMTMLIEKGERSDFLSLYTSSSQFLAVVIFSVTAMIACFGEHLIYSWTGNADLSAWGGPIIVWLVIGNGILAVETLLYVMQFAHGKLKLHTIGSTISCVIQIPIIYYAVSNYGAHGAAISWFCFRAVFFTVWSGYVHSVLLPNFHLKWFSSVALIAISAGISSYVFSLLITISDDRVLSFLQLISIGLLVLLVALVSSSVIRSTVRSRLAMHVANIK